MGSRVVGVEDCGNPDFRWITLKRIHWEDPHGRQRVWESAERTTRHGDVDGVAIVAKILRRGKPALLPVLKQYRPPIANYCLELPAGLVDAGETAAEAAVRELREETGYSGRALDVTPICVSDPGMSNANMRYVVLEVDGDAPENQDVRQQLEDGEFIQVELVPWSSLLQHIYAELEATGCAVDARLLSYAWGLEHAKEAAALAVAAAAAAASAEGRGAAAAAALAAASSAAIPVPQAQQAALRGGSSSADTAASLLVQGGVQGRSTTDAAAVESTAGTGPPLAFGSPVMSALVPPAAGGSSGGTAGETAQPPAALSDGSQDSEASAAGREQSFSASTAGDPPATALSAASGEGGKQQLSAGSGCGSSWQRAGALLASADSGRWLAFAAGVAAGAAGCCLLLTAARGGGGRAATSALA